MLRLRGRILWVGLLVVAHGFSIGQSNSQSKPANDPSLLQSAAQAIKAGKLNLAETDLLSVLRSAPEEYRALDLLGVVRVLQHRDAEAETLFTQAVQKKSDFAPAWAHRGLLYIQLGREEEAVPQLGEAVRLDPARSDASSALVTILRKQAQAAVSAGNSEKALPLLLEARKWAPDNPDLQFEFGTAALSISLFQDAADAFQRVLQLRANDPLAVYDLGRAFMGLAKFEDAQVQFARYVQLRPDDPSGYCARGMTLAALEHPEEARGQFERSIALAPEQTESYYRLGLLDLEAKNLDAADRNLRIVLDHNAGHTGALTALGRVAFDRKHYSEAIDFLERAISKDDSLREAHYYLGLALVRTGRKQESEQQLQIATHLEHDEAQRRRVVFTLDPGPVNPETSPAQK